jgi:DNA-binding MarR family transcriptional regulator
MVGPRADHLSRLLRLKFNEAANAEGLFSGQHHIILLLKEESGLTISQLSERLGVAPATVSVSVKRMEKAGFVIRKPDEKDARIVRLYLTAKGNEIPERIREKMDAQESTITKGFTEEEKLQFCNYLDLAIKNLKEDGMNG